MNRRLFLATTAGAFLAPRLHAKTSPRPSLDTLLEATRTPGLVARGMIDGKAFQMVGGVREAGKPERMSADLLFCAASLTKPVFAMEVRRLVREGKLEWKKPLQDYMPLGLPAEAAGITTEHVLTHATGLQNWRFDPKDQLKSSFPPGTQWQYSGEGYVMLQRVVEKIVGKPLGAHLNSTLLPQLGMTNSTFTWSPAVEKNAVGGHDNRGRVLERSVAAFQKSTYAIAEKAGATPDQMTYDELVAAGPVLPVAVVPNMAGSLWTTAGDYYTFLQKTLADFAAHPDEYRPMNRVNSSISWTLSWGVDSSLDSPGYFHWGDSPGVKNFAWWQPQKKTAIVILTNSDHGASAYRMVLRELLHADPVAPEWV